MSGKKEKNLVKIKINNFVKRNKIGIAFTIIFLILISISFVANYNKNNSIQIEKNKIYGDDKITMIYFHWTKCPHCIEQNKFNKYLKIKYPNLKIIEYEITNPKTSKKYEEVAKKFIELPNSWEKFPGTPISIIGNKSIVGYGNEKTTGKILIKMIEKEQKIINRNWNEKTMKRTSQLNN